MFEEKTVFSCWESVQKFSEDKEVTLGRKVSVENDERDEE